MTSVSSQKATLPPAEHRKSFSFCLVSQLNYNTCILAAVSFLLAGAQSFGVGQAVNGDHTNGAGHCQKTQSGHERSLWDLLTFQYFIHSKLNLVVMALTTAYLCARVGGLPAPRRTPFQIPDEAFVLGQTVGQGGLGAWTAHQRPHNDSLTVAFNHTQFLTEDFLYSTGWCSTSTCC